MAEAGEIRDAKSLVGLLWLARQMEHGDLGMEPSSDAESLPIAGAGAADAEEAPPPA